MKQKLQAVILLLILFLPLSACKQEETIVIGFIPAQDSGNAADSVQPLIDRLSEKLSDHLNAHVDGKVMMNYSAVIDAMGSNEIQIGILPAFGYVLANEEYDVRVILKTIRNGRDAYRGQYIVRSDSGISHLEDLEGKIWAYPEATSTSGYLFPAKQLMNELNIDSSATLETNFFHEAIETGTHWTSVFAVLDGDADVATTTENILDNLRREEPSIKDELTVIDYTQKIPETAIAVAPGVDEHTTTKIKEAFLSLNEDDEALQVMQDVYKWDGFTHGENSDYNFVRETYYEFKDILKD